MALDRTSQRTVTIRTIGDLGECDQLYAYCSACRHNSQLDLAALRERYGPQLSLKNMRARLACLHAEGCWAHFPHEPSKRPGSATKRKFSKHHCLSACSQKWTFPQRSVHTGHETDAASRRLSTLGQLIIVWRFRDRETDWWPPVGISTPALFGNAKRTRYSRLNS
jgi:hypothetical protein